MATSDGDAFILPDGRSLSYQLSPAPESGPIVLLANSLLADFTSWDHVVPRLQSSGFRTLRYDQPGHGKSGVPEDLSCTTFETLGDDVAALLEHLGLATIHAWVGVSMGAATSIFFVARHPGIVNKLVVCDTISISPVKAGGPDIFRARVEAARREGSLVTISEQTLERWFGKEWMVAKPDETARMRGLMATTSMDGFETCCAALRSPTFDLAPLLPSVGRGCNEALLVVGEKDADLPEKMQEMRSGIEDGFRAAGNGTPVHLRVVKGAGHVSYVDGLGGFCDVVIPFLGQG